MNRRSAAGLAIVLAIAIAAKLFDVYALQPRTVAIACLHGTVFPPVCVLRSTINLLAHYGLIGTAALALALWSFRGAPFWVTIAALSLGITAAIDYNVTWGILAASLATWTWLREMSGAATVLTHKSSTKT